MSKKKEKTKPSPRPVQAQKTAGQPAASVPDQDRAFPQRQKGFKHRAAGITDPAASASADLRGDRPVFWPAALICAVFCFFAITGAWTLRWDNQLVYVLACAVLFFAVYIRKGMRELLWQTFSPVQILLFALSLLYLAGMFYAWFQKLALLEFFINTGGLLLFSVLYILVRRNREIAGRFFAVLAVCIGAISLLSIELATSRLFFVPLHALSELLGQPISDSFAALESNTRIFTVMDNPNVYAATAAVGVFLSLQRHAAETDRLRRSLFFALGVLNGIAFVLCFSLGSFAALFPALCVWLYLAEKENRKALLIPAVVLIAASFAGAGLVFAALGVGVLPVLLTLAVSLGTGFLFQRIRLPALPRPGFLRKKKTVLAAVISLLAVLLCSAAVLQGPYTLEQGDSIRRAVSLKEGACTLVVAFSGSTGDTAAVEITSMSYSQAALKENTLLASGDLQSGGSISFDVPKDSAAVFFRFSSQTELVLEKVSFLGDSESGSVPLRYLLVPEFIVNRLQGLWVNDNAIQRLVFFRDGIRLGLTSPLIGLGGGAFEGGARSVADYYYATAHAHNQYIQSFVDGGLIGLCLFAALAVFAFLTLYRAKKEGKHPQLLPYLGGAVSLVFFHSLLEIDFMQPAFRTMACALLAILAALFPLGNGISPNRLVKRILSAAGAILAVIAVLLSAGRIWAVQGMAGAWSLSTLQANTMADPFNGDDYKLSFLLSTAQTNSISLLSQGKEYLNSIESRRIIPGTAFYLVKYHLQKTEPDYGKAAEMAEVYIRGERVRESAWNDVLSLYNLAVWTADAEGKRILAESVDSLCAYLRELNHTLPKKITPEQALAQYLWAERILSGDDILAGSDRTYDLDCDGVSDLIAYSSDGVPVIRIPVVNSASLSCSVRVRQAQDAPPAVFLDGRALSCSYLPEEGAWIAQSVLFSDNSLLEITAEEHAGFTVSLGPSD